MIVLPTILLTVEQTSSGRAPGLLATFIVLERFAAAVGSESQMLHRGDSPGYRCSCSLKNGKFHPPKKLTTLIQIIKATILAFFFQNLLLQL